MKLSFLFYYSLFVERSEKQCIEVNLKRNTPLIVSILICLTIMLLVFIVESIEKQRFHETLRAQTLSTLSQLRANIEKGINEGFYLTRGLIVFVATHPELDQRAFHLWAKNLLSHHNSIINIGLAPNNIISFVHPLEGNERAIGLDYTKNEKQWPAVKAAIDSQKTVVAGPVKLVQGGTAFISRTPIYIDSAESGRDKEYWGMASIVIDKDKLFRSTGFYSFGDKIQVAIRGADGLGEQGGLIDGPEKIFSQEPVLLDVLLPRGSWQLAAVPSGGWLQSSPSILWIRSFGFCLAALVAGGVFSWIRRTNQTRVKIEQSWLKAEQAGQALTKSEKRLQKILDKPLWGY